MSRTARSTRRDEAAGGLLAIAFVFGTAAANLVLGFALGSYAAPSSESAPLLGAFLLVAAFGLAYGALEMAMVLAAPLLLLRWAWRRVRGRDAPTDDRDETRASWFFVAAYTGLATMGGAALSAVAGGSSIAQAALLFGGCALLLGAATRGVIRHLGPDGGG